MKKDAIERICRSVGLIPERRAKLNGAEVFIADGFAAMPHQKFARFGVEPGEFPFGCYVTLWWASRKEDELDTGQPLFFDAFHDPSLDTGSKKLARINTAIKTADEFLTKRERARHA